jgi:3-phosphoshikimate 1-carboxyvinyltransferase
MCCLLPFEFRDFARVSLNVTRKVGRALPWCKPGVKARAMHGSSPASLARTMSFSARGPLRGTITVPGDKSISHRALMFSALAVGESRIEGLLEGEDVLATAAAMRAMGASVERDADGTWRVHGVGVGGLLQPQQALEMGNSGTSTRLLMGLVASHAITVTFTGDASLSSRPMGRVIEPLASMGADVTASPGANGSQTLPLMLRGICPAVPIEYTLPVASAQVKSAILLAGLNTPGITRVIEPVPTRDHSERMLAGFGADLTVEEGPEGRIISIRGEAELKPQDITVPGDPSSAGFWLVAASIVPGSDVTVTNVCMNPTRTGLIAALRLMGADITESNARTVGGEPVADLIVRHAPLRAIEVPPELAPSMIDEYPILFVAASQAEGRTVARGAHELRVKESDRIAVMAEALAAVGVPVEEFEDGLAIQGSGGAPLAGGARIASKLDHRIAMSMAIAGLVAKAPVEIDDVSPIATSYPNFLPTLDALTE